MRKTRRPAGCRGGTGLDVWEIAAWRASAEDFDRLRQSYGRLTESQLRAALAYYELYPQEIDARLRREAEWTTERVASDLPYARPRNG